MVNIDRIQEDHVRWHRESLEKPQPVREFVAKLIQLLNFLPAT